MKSTKITSDAGAETRVVILESGEEAFAALAKFANDAGITTASLTAIGAFENATVGWFDFEKKTYKKIEVDQQCEVLSAIGDVAVGTTANRAFTFMLFSACPTAQRAAGTFLRARSGRRWKSF
jgi:uncharacterized protein